VTACDQPPTRRPPCRTPGGLGQLRGFTLLELLIALVLVSLITLLLFSGLRLGTRAWEGVEATADRTAEIRVARNFLDRELLQARQIELTVDAQRRFVFAGDSQAIEFVSPLSEHVGIPGLYVLRLTLDPGQRHRRLVLTRWLLNPDVLAGDDKVPEWRPLERSQSSLGLPASLEDDIAAGAFGSIVLLDAVGELEFAYFGAQQGELEPVWHADWTDQPRPPQAVRVHLTTTNQVWPDSVIRLADPMQ
jgi:general secretion pathway protein J